MSLTIICQECHRAAATTNMQISPGVLIALCDACVVATDKAMEEDIECYHCDDRDVGRGRCKCSSPRTPAGTP